MKTKKRPKGPEKTQRLIDPFRHLKDEINIIKAIVAKISHIDVSAFYQKTKGKIIEIAWPRQIAMHFCHKYTISSSMTVGDRFNRDHGTVLFAHRAVEAELDEGNPRSARLRLFIECKNEIDQHPKFKAIPREPMPQPIPIPDNVIRVNFRATG